MVSHKRLQAIIKSYNKHNKERLEGFLARYRRLRQLDEVLQEALWPKGKKHPHQIRIKNRILKRVKDNLTKNRQDIKDCKTFEQLIDLVSDNKVKGFGKLAIYDTALRIGAYLGVAPRKVYLQAGTRKGARVLGLDVSERTLEMHKLPSPLRRLKPMHVENLLCIYRNELAGINSPVRHRRCPGKPCH